MSAPILIDEPSNTSINESGEIVTEKFSLTKVFLCEKQKLVKIRKNKAL